MLTDTGPVLVCRVLLVAALLGLGGCGTLYIAQAARGEVAVLAERRPITRVIADPRTPATVRAKLESVADIRSFASRELGLPDNASYRSYADIGRPYVVWNVVATPEFSVDPLRWCFPVAGCVAYRGYFSEARAEAFARQLRARGNDAFVGGVPAYSTLGRFADPILSTMIGYSDADLAALVFHELAHQIVYVPGDTAFNESFAETVEAAGLARWLEARGRLAELEAHRARARRQQEFVTLLGQGRERLRTLFAAHLPATLLRERKQEILAEIGAEIRALDARLGLRSGYEKWVDAGLNNAHLASVGTYFDCVPAFEQLLAGEGSELPGFYAAVRRIARAPAPARRVFCASGGVGAPATTPQLSRRER